MEAEAGSKSAGLRTRRERKQPKVYEAVPASRHAGGDFVEGRQPPKGFLSENGREGNTGEPDPELNRRAKEKAIARPSTRGKEIVDQRVEVSLHLGGLSLIDMHS